MITMYTQKVVASGLSGIRMFHLLFTPNLLSLLPVVFLTGCQTWRSPQFLSMLTRQSFKEESYVQRLKSLAIFLWLEIFQPS